MDDETTFLAIAFKIAPGLGLKWLDENKNNMIETMKFCNINNIETLNKKINIMLFNFISMVSELLPHDMYHDLLNAFFLQDPLQLARAESPNPSTKLKTCAIMLKLNTTKSQIAITEAGIGSIISAFSEKLGGAGRPQFSRSTKNSTYKPNKDLMHTNYKSAHGSNKQPDLWGSSNGSFEPN